MRPLTHSSPKNPCELDGFAFVEFSGPEPQHLHAQFKSMGFHLTAIHRHQPVYLYEQGNIQFIVNETADTQAARHAKIHGAGACAMGFRVKDMSKAYDYTLKKGATPFTDAPHCSHHLKAIEGIGGSIIYFVDEKHQPFGADFDYLNEPSPTPSCHLTDIDHLTHNVFRGHMDEWADFYANLFNFHQIRFFNIVGQFTGLISRALSSPCGKIKIPLNESKDEKSQIEEFLKDYKGEGIQHIALNSRHIYQSVEQLRANGVGFLTVPDTYYEMINNRIPWHNESIEALSKGRILIDGEKEKEHGLLLQIFTENVFGPVFFEIIQRHGNEGFGEGNFQALFEAIERDQIKRGTLNADSPLNRGNSEVMS